jgi:hypothetical protein
LQPEAYLTPLTSAQDKVVLHRWYELLQMESDSWTTEIVVGNRKASNASPDELLGQPTQVSHFNPETPISENL